MDQFVPRCGEFDLRPRYELCGDGCAGVKADRRRDDDEVVAYERVVATSAQQVVIAAQQIGVVHVVRHQRHVGRNALARGG